MLVISDQVLGGRQVLSVETAVECAETVVHELNLCTCGKGGCFFQQGDKGCKVSRLDTGIYASSIHQALHTNRESRGQAWLTESTRNSRNVKEHDQGDGSHGNAQYKHMHLPTGTQGQYSINVIHWRGRTNVMMMQLQLWNDQTPAAKGPDSV